jgi:hypothetical protein
MGDWLIFGAGVLAGLLAWFVIVVVCIYAPGSDDEIEALAEALRRSGRE